MDNRKAVTWSEVHLPLYISNKHFRPGGMAMSEWTRSIRAVTDMQVADRSAPGINNTRHIAYCAPIAVSPFFLPVSVSCFKRTIWHCGQQ